MAKSKIIETPSHGRQKLTVSQPERDPEGKTATDRQIEKNRAAKRGRSDQSLEEARNEARSNLRPLDEIDQVGSAINIRATQSRTIVEAATTPVPGTLPDLLRTPSTYLALATLTAGAGIAIGAFTAARTAVATAATTGGHGLIPGATGTAATIATNSATRVVTASWLSKLAIALKNPAFVVSGVLAMIGSYPFAGFIKEEALQTLSYGVRTAINNGDLEGAELAIDEQRDILDPGLWDQIKGGIPFINVVDKLNDFYAAARIKLEIDDRVVQDLKIQQETGETEEEKWERVSDDEKAQNELTVDYYNAERKKLLEWEREAEKAARDEDAAFWAAQASKQRKFEEEDRKAIADFWTEYRKTMQKLQDDSRPSKLNFGLL